MSDLIRSSIFYQSLFGILPAKQRFDYVKFELNDPPLVLSLIPSGIPGAGSLNHLGLRVRDSEELVSIQHRLEVGGFTTHREEGVECCHSTQTKFWVSDPDRILWEIYILHPDADAHGLENVPETARAGSFARSVERPRIVWRHQLSDPFPRAIDGSDNSVDAILLDGTGNASEARDHFGVLLSDAFRVLRPGGELRLHGIAADATLPDSPLHLPGPAAAVRFVPSISASAQKLHQAGFAGIRFEKLSQKAYFHVANIGLREMLLLGFKPGYRPKRAQHGAIYLGSMSTVTDDFGNRFHRGERVPLNVHD